MIEVKTIDAMMLREMVNAGAALLEKNRDAVNALNVFPVPDGDTGTNMSMTMVSAVREINSKDFASVGEATQALAKGALRGARGNSGVILSQLYRGFSKSLEGLETITPVQFAAAIKNSADTAYKAVMKPKEGTILTVARVIAEDAARQVQAEPDDYESLFRVMLSSGEKILSRTQEMLPALKQAGVVDAGGRGLLLIYSGYAAVLRGEHIEDTYVDMSGDVAAETPFVDDHEAIGEIQFAYCTEYSIQNMKEETNEVDVAGLRRRLNRIGDCVLVVGDAALVKVHVHTNDPGKALQYGTSLGELVNMKIENMLQQHRETMQPGAGTNKEPPKPYGIVAVSLGEGFSQILKDLGVDAIVNGGQTMNPSIEDLQKAVDSVNAENIFILPNNGNITLAAKQVAEMCEMNVIVLPTKNVAMGIAAVIAFQPELPPEENEMRMNEAASRVRTGMITFAVRDSDIEDLHITEGSIIGLNNGVVTANSDSIHEVALELMRQIVTDDDGLITVYGGTDVTEEDAKALGKEIADVYDFCDVEVHMGGQPLYYYLLSVE
ncbi:MAG: DAK2 domain-containing protein [Eubacteriales bacterium]|nr:DAK2 domain-containing protein [Eubacteriales bacterium]